jgi:hypothetical protein
MPATSRRGARVARRHDEIKPRTETRAHLLPWRCLLRAAAIAAVSMTACSRGPARVHPPKIDPATAAAAALAEYDRNGDGALSDEELVAAPALQTAKSRLDVDPQDGRITAAEIAERIESWQATRLAILPISCSVQLGGRPLRGATVTLEPESFLGDAVKPATGTTLRHGSAGLSVAKPFRPAPTAMGVQCGFYKIRISKLQGDRETIPARYNAKTTLGVEVAPDATEVQTGTIALKLTK